MNQVASNNDNNLLQKRLDIFFDAEYYKQLYPDVIDFQGSYLDHYLKHGWYESRKPNAWYSDSMVPLGLSTQFSGSPTFVIFLTYLPNLTVSEFEQLCFSNRAIEGGHEDCWECNLMRDHFNPKYYRYKYSDAKNIHDALVHFCEIGWKEGKNPNLDFDTRYYLAVNQDVFDANINPFVHYLSQAAEGRLPKAIDNVRKKILSSMRSINNISNDYEKIVPKLSFQDKDLFFKKLVSLESKLCLSISQDDYTAKSGGIQQFIKDESRASIEAGLTYLNMHPTKPNNMLVQGSIETTLVNCYIDNDFFGTFVAKEIIEVFKRIRSIKQDLFYVGVVHSVMGWNITSLINIFEVNFNEIYFYVHDYYSLCHEYRLLRNNIDPCDAPSISSLTCSICINKNGRDTHLIEFDNLFKSLKPKLIFPSITAEKIFRNAEPQYQLNRVLIPHVKVLKNINRSDVKIVPQNVKTKIRVAYWGDSTSQQGIYHFLELVNNCVLLDDFDFIYFGSESGDLPEIIFIDIASEAGEIIISEFLRRYEVDIVFLPSIWREPISRIAYEVLKAGAAILTLETSGDIADLVHTYRVGEVVTDDVSAIQLLHSPDIKSKLHEWKVAVNQLGFVNNLSFLSVGEIV